MNKRLTFLGVILISLFLVVILLAQRPCNPDPNCQEAGGHCVSEETGCSQDEMELESHSQYCPRGEICCIPIPEE